MEGYDTGHRKWGVPMPKWEARHTPGFSDPSQPKAVPLPGDRGTPGTPSRQA